MAAELKMPVPTHDSNGALLKRPLPWFRAQLSRGRNHYEWEDDHPDGMVEPDDVPRMIDRLSPGQLRYIRLRATGKSCRQSARELGTTSQRAHRWEESPWFRPAVQMELDHEWGDPNYMIRPLAPLVARVLDETLRGHFGDVARVEMARYVCDRLYGKTPATQVMINQGPDESSTVRSITELIRSVDAARRAVALAGEDAVDVEHAQPAAV